MKKKSLFVGVVQIILSIVIICGGGVLGYIEYHKSCRMAALLDASRKQASVYVKGVKSLETALSPVKKGVDAIVKLRDKKFVAPVGRAFVGLQTSCLEAQISLREARVCFEQVERLQLKNETRYDIYGVICLVCIFAFIGLGLLSNGIYICVSDDENDNACASVNDNACASDNASVSDNANANESEVQK